MRKVSRQTVELARQANPRDRQRLDNGSDGLGQREDLLADLVASELNGIAS